MKNFQARLQESIIDMETVLGAIAEAKHSKPRGRRGPLDLLEAEPALHEFLKGALLEVVGNMAIDGCPPAVIRTVYREAAYLLAVTYKAVTQAHRNLYADLLPQTQTETDAEPAEPQADQDLSPSLDGGNEANRPSKKEPKP